MPSIHLVWNPKHTIVQWVGIGTDRQTNKKSINDNAYYKKFTNKVIFFNIVLG